MGCMLCSCDQNDIPTHFLYSSTASMKACNQKVHDSKYSVHPGQPIFHDLACMVPHMIQKVLSPLIGTYASDTVRRKMFAINNFREFREWNTFANIIIRELYVAHTRYIYLCMHYIL